MGKAENSELVGRLYEALDREDVPAVVALCAPDVEWRYPAAGALPYGGLWVGPEEVARFLEAHDAAEEILEFRRDAMVADGNRAVVFGFFRGRAKPGGHAWETNFVHAITVDGGLLQRFEAYFDTAAAVTAHPG